MTDRPADNINTKEIEFAVCGLDSLSVYPAVINKFLSQLNQFRLTPALLLELAESEPALAIRLFSLVSDRHNNTSDYKPDLQWMIENVGLRVVRDAILTLKIYSGSGERLSMRRELIRHSLAVAVCAGEIARLAGAEKPDRQQAYLAGLLHDTGKLALDEIMPRSFMKIYEQSQKEEISFCTVEKRNLGTDHTILGRRLCNRWHFPAQITHAVWLHHFDFTGAAESLRVSKTAACVQAADIITRSCGIGESGSFDTPVLPVELLDILQITSEQVEQMSDSLTEEVERKCKNCGLDEPTDSERLGDNIQNCAVHICQENRKLSEDVTGLQIDSMNLKFFNDFLSSVSAGTDSRSLVQNFAGLWQKFFQTGLVCVYLIPQGDSQVLEAAIAYNQSQVKSLLLKRPSDFVAFPGPIAGQFDVVDVFEGFDWLFEQVDAEFDLSRTIALPLLELDGAVAVVIFELRHPARKDKLRGRFEKIGSLCGIIFRLVCEKQNQQQFAELFSQLIRTPEEYSDEKPVRQVVEQSEQVVPEDINMESLAETAAGAAHELNNPLLLISGRAQQLAANETDAEKKKILEQIQTNAQEISSIADVLFSFAQPKKPKPRKADLGKMLEKACLLAGERAGADTKNISIENNKGVENIYVDSAQITEALSEIIRNAIESYIKKAGPINIIVEPAEQEGLVKIIISDLGCGMDVETIRKSVFPFFSAKPAGRKRGMGLALAKRFITLNRGFLDIESKVAQGTVVTVILPS